MLVHGFVATKAPHLLTLLTVDWCHCDGITPLSMLMPLSECQEAHQKCLDCLYRGSALMLPLVK